MKRAISHGWLFPAVCLLLLATTATAKPVPRAMAVAPESTFASEQETVTHTITLADFGAQDLAYLAVPAQPPRGGVVVVPDSWGLTPATKQAAEELAKAGFVALAVDLYNGQKANSPADASRMAAQLQPVSAVRSIHAAVRFLHESPKYRTPHTALIGWNLGGTLALEAAAAPPSLPTTEVDAVALLFAPIPSTNAKVWKHLRAPVLAFFSEMNRASADAFAQLMRRLEKPLAVEFANPSRGLALGPQALAELGGNRVLQEQWQRVTDFFTTELSKPPEPKGWWQRMFGKNKNSGAASS